MADNQHREEPGYVPAYDGLRFFLLVGVLEYHYLLYKVDIKYFWWLTYALCCFFALSGFLITSLLLGGESLPLKQALWNFYLRRGLRIFPAYYVVVITAFICLGIPYFTWHLVYLFNVKCFAVSLDHQSLEAREILTGWQTNGIHLWSMGVEEQFYLLYPPLLLLCPRRLRTGGLFLGILACIGTRVWLCSRFPDSLYGVLLPVPGEYLLWGCLFAWLDHQGQANWARSPLILYGAMLAFLTLLLSEPDLQRYLKAQMQPPPGRQTLYAVVLALFVLALRHQGKSWPNRLLSLPLFARLGKISYGTYLVHLFLNPVVDRLLAWFPALAIFPQAPRALLGPVVSLTVAGMMWMVFEHRLNQAKDLWTSPAFRRPSVMARGRS
jgi:peptidoglycan/LPS O-acetylase OafA/YrhL